MEYRVKTTRGPLRIAARSQSHAEKIACDDGHTVILEEAPYGDVLAGGTVPVPEPSPRNRPELADEQCYFALADDSGGGPV